ncbi:low-specificity L-threonine aldolase [Longirhabdus pacifica]|uniref:low-specificity L-threonine aldolase n=1 Tax=Longirhabdus pacifica TaxID=2305227 RepID=UPI001008FB64|nr:low-specificity L-threonine aldolase [Longirhabdus pacifica]
MIELRSDTFTLPTKEMLEAIPLAALGDDVYQEDPTVKQLQQHAADVMGKEAAIFMPSGTMANLSAIMAHSPRGSKVLVGDETDIFIYEAGGAAVCGGVMYEPIRTKKDGTLAIEDLAEAIPKEFEDPQFALPSLICLENPHNRMGGRVLPLSYLHEVSVFAKENQLPVHMDGARVFNAAVALDLPVNEIAQYADSLQFCLSKGLSAPIGSMVVGSHDFIQKVYRIRKMLGGGMRQVGIMAAPGIVALEKMVDRLREDHQNAYKLAEGLSRMDGIHCDIQMVETNIVFFTIEHPNISWQNFVKMAKERGLHVAELGYGRIRAVTHAGVKSSEVDEALEIIEHIMQEAVVGHFS